MLGLGPIGVTSQAAAATPAAVEDADDEDDSPDAIAADDMRDVDAQLMRSSRRYRRNRDPVALTDKHVLLARRFAAGEPPFVAAMTAPLKYRRRAVRSLVNTPAWQAIYEQLRHERSPTIADLIEATRTRDPGVSPSVPFTSTPGYSIKLRTTKPAP
jgi:hypothetical protein